MMHYNETKNLRLRSTPQKAESKENHNKTRFPERKNTVIRSFIFPRSNQTTGEVDIKDLREEQEKKIVKLRSNDDF